MNSKAINPMSLKTKQSLKRISLDQKRTQKRAQFFFIWDATEQSSPYSVFGQYSDLKYSKIEIVQDEPKFLRSENICFKETRNNYLNIDYCTQKKRFMSFILGLAGITHICIRI